MSLLEIIFIMATLSACIYIVIEKWGLIDLQVHGPKYLPPAECSFCFMFWISVSILLVILILSPDISYLVAPFCAAPISKAIYENCKTTRG
jgi:hypothetical protein